MNEQQDFYFSATITSTIPKRPQCLMREGAPISVLAPEAAACELRDIAQAGQEMFVILTLNVKNKLIGKHIITVGLLDTCPAHPREIFRRAILDNAANIILAHNHPSGDPAPSAEDIKLTKQLLEAGKVVGVPVIDHVIVGLSPMGELSHMSMRESGLVNFTV